MMPEYRRSVLVILSIFLLTASLHAQELPVLKGPYLGQNPPGMTPEMFAPGFVSTDAHEFSCTFSPDGNEFYFARAFGKFRKKYVMVTKNVNGSWTEPEKCLTQFNNENFEPHITHDGQKMFFMGFNTSGGGPHPIIDLYYVERKDSAWGEPKRMEKPFNPGKSMFASTTMEGIIYTSDAEKMGIARSLPVNGEYQDYEDLGAPISIKGFNAYPFIAPDESYLIFVSDRLGREKGLRLFVTFNVNGTWSEPREVPVGIPGGTPCVSPDGKYLFFVADRPIGNIYWVDSKIFRDLAPKK